MVTKLKKSVKRNNKIASVPITASNPEILVFHVTGTSPLLQNNPANLIGSPNEGLSTKKKYNDSEEAELRLYIDEEGQYYHPTISFKKCMQEAAKGRKFGKQFATKLVEGNVFEAEPNTLILDSRGNPIKKYSIDRRPVVVGKARILRCRPCWTNWTMDVALDVDTAVLGRDQVLLLLTLAGRTKGIGDFRPQRGGGFGRFTVE